MSGRRYRAPDGVSAHDAAVVEEYVAWLRAANLSPDTVRIRRRHVLDLATRGPLLEATASTLAAWLDRPSWGTSARHNARTTLRLFYAWCVDEELLQRDPTRRLPRVRQPRPAPRPVPLHVYAAAYGRADLRARRALLLERYAGLRRSEVAKVHGRDLVDLPDGQPALVVVGKGGHGRVVPLHPLVAVELVGLDGYLFPGRKGAGTARGERTGHLHEDTVGRIVSDLLGPGWTGHTLRHRAASDWYAVTLDIRAVQDLLGHASVLTTQRYTATPDGATVAAVLGVTTPPTGPLSAVPGPLQRAG